MVMTNAPHPIAWAKEDGSLLLCVPCARVLYPNATVRRRFLLMLVSEEELGPNPDAEVCGLCSRPLLR